MASYFESLTPSVPPRPPLRGEQACDVLVIGGGICGILTAHLLAARGVDTALVEAHRLLSGQTGGTTAKITAQHGLFAAKLLRAVGRERASGYVQANLDAVNALCALVKSSGADCALARMPAFLYTLGNPRILEDEAAACAQIGLPAAPTRRLPAPILPAAALRVDDQAQFNPLPLLQSLAASLRVYEHSRALSLDGCTARTPEGVIRAKAVAVCTHYPAFTLPGAYFLRLYQERSYSLALKTQARVEGMLIGAGADGYSLRSAPGAVFLGGEGHRSGDARAAQSCYAHLRQAAQRIFPDAQELAHWSAQDCVTPDSIPYVGRYSRRMPDVYVATGFGKWGMTNAMAAAQILCDEIAASGSPYADVFSPQRAPGLTAAGAMLAQAGHAVTGLGASILPPPMRTADSLAPGEAAVVREGTRKRACYRDARGALHSLSPYCAHMRCLLRFNASEQTWDCPCHGSRFTVDGELIGGPAQRNQL